MGLRCNRRLDDLRSHASLLCDLNLSPGAHEEVAGCRRRRAAVLIGKAVLRPSAAVGRGVGDRHRPVLRGKGRSCRQSPWCPCLEVAQGAARAMAEAADSPRKRGGAIMGR